MQDCISFHMLHSFFASELDAADRVTEESLETFAVEDLRAVLMFIATRMRRRLHDTETQENEMNALAREITQMQNVRRLTGFIAFKKKNEFFCYEITIRN